MIPRALSRPCPRCGAGVGSRCWSSSKIPTRMATTHPERREKRAEPVSVPAPSQPKERVRPALGVYATRGPHGTQGRYKSGCRCDACVDGNLTAQRNWHDKARGTLAPNDPRHGTLTGYHHYHCRCAPCTAASTDYNRELRERTRRAAAMR